VADDAIATFLRSLPENPSMWSRTERCETDRNVGATRLNSDGSMYRDPRREDGALAVHYFRCGAVAVVQIPRRNGRAIRGLGRLPCPFCFPDGRAQRGLKILRTDSSRCSQKRWS
jgi:hypothetical protein